MAQTARIEPSPENTNTPAILVIGRNGTETPRGAWFEQGDFKLAKAGAQLMGMHAIRAAKPEIIELALRLPKGRVFDSGKLFAPKIQTSVFEQLLTHVSAHGIMAKPKLISSLKAVPDAKQSSSKGQAGNDGKYPTDWSDIKQGNLVLAEDAKGEGWFEAIVLDEVQGRGFALKWRDFPDEPKIVRSASRIALMMPAAAKK